MSGRAEAGPSGDPGGGAGFRLVSEYRPAGDQPAAIEKLSAGLEAGERFQTLLGVTGSGKTYTVANVIARLGRPTLVLSHNKALAAQLYSEFKAFFPENAVEYFVSYYDYYQPEAYVPQSDTYIQKDASRNDELDRLRLSATTSVLARRDVVVVSSVSCIYGLGSPENYRGMVVPLIRGRAFPRADLVRGLTEIQYTRNDVDFARGTFRVRGDVVEVFPAYATSAVRVELFGDEIEKLLQFDPLTGSVESEPAHVYVYPASHHVTPKPELERAIAAIRAELTVRHGALQSAGKLLEAQRIWERTTFDLEMMRELGYCSGIENYSRHLDGRAEGSAPWTLLDYLPKDTLIVVDESHMTIPQLHAMHAGDRARKNVLVDYGFRLPSALDNRPLRFEEFLERTGQIVFVSATPGPWELEQSRGSVARQIVRPTGLMDPQIAVRPTKGQMDDLLGEIRKRTARKERVLVTTLTKRMAEDLTEYFAGLGVAVRYMHAETETLERVKLVRDLRLGEYDVLVGINLLREGLDLPEVSLVAILDADKEGYLRSERALIQTIGRAARHADGTVFLYADAITDSMRRAMDETARRRERQGEYNREHRITPVTVKKEIRDLIRSVWEHDYYEVPMAGEDSKKYGALSDDEVPGAIARLEGEMRTAAAGLEFEKAAELRDRVRELRQRQLGLPVSPAEPPAGASDAAGGSSASKRRSFRKGRWRAPSWRS